MEKVVRLRHADTIEQEVNAAAKLTEIAVDAEEPPAIRCAAVESLAHLRRPEALPVFGSLAVNDDDPDVRRWATWALGLTDDPVAADYLLQAIRFCGDPPAAQQVLESLNGFTAVLKTNTDTRLLAVHRINAAESRHGRSQAVRRYAQAFRTELVDFDVALHLLRERGLAGDPSALHEAVGALGRFLLRDRGTDDAGLRAEAIDELTALLAHDHPAVRLRALWFLGRLADGRAAPALLTAARTSDDRATRLMALWALERTDPVLLRKEFTPLPDDALAPTPETWRDAQRAAAESGEPDLEIQRFISRAVRGEGAP
jgi:hypothetical protein